MYPRKMIKKVELYFNIDGNKVRLDENGEYESLGKKKTNCCSK